MNLTLFDLDHTLIPLDSDHAWGEFTIGLGWRDGEDFRRRNDLFFRQYQEGRLDLSAYVAFATEAIRERGLAEATQARARFMAEVIGPALKPAAKALVAQHRQAGDAMAIVTATNEFVTEPIAEAFGVPDLLAVQLQTDEHGEFTGCISGVPTYQHGKVARVGEWLSARGQDWDAFERVYVYSDSINDLPLLERATHPVATNPSTALLAIAEQRGWQVLRLFS